MVNYARGFNQSETRIALFHPLLVCTSLSHAERVFLVSLESSLSIFMWKEL